MKTLINRYLALIVSLVLLAAMSAQAQVNYDKITYIHTDAAGTPVAASDEQGDLVWSIEHYPYGEEYANDANNRAGSLSFAGKAYDEETGLSYFGGRWYNAHIGRFMGIDPVGVDPEDWRSFNRYSYGFNNPYKYVDPDGNFPILAAVAIVGGLNVLGLYLETRYDAANPCNGCARSSGGIDIGLSAGLAKAGSAIGAKLASSAKEVANPVPETLARVVSGNINPVTLGRTKDVFVTDASVLRGLDAKQVADKLTIPESSSGFKVIEFPSKNVSGIASPVNRNNPGFVGGGKTAGGAPEFVIPNGGLPKGSKIKDVK